MPRTVETSELRWEPAFIEVMRRERVDAGMSQSELARRLAERGLAFHQQTVQRVESGERPVRLNEAMEIAVVLDFDLSAVLLSPGDRERLLAFVRGTMEAQSEDYRSIALATKDLLAKQSLALDRLREARHDWDDWDDAELALLAELGDWLATRTPEAAVQLGRSWLSQMLGESMLERLESDRAALAGDAPGDEGGVLRGEHRDAG